MRADPDVLANNRLPLRPSVETQQGVMRSEERYELPGRRPIADLSDQMMDSRLLPEEQLLKQQEESELREALRQLSDDDQKVLILRFVERKSHQVVADILGKQVSAVKTAQYRALLRLSGLLGSEKKARHYLRGNDD